MNDQLYFCFENCLHAYISYVHVSIEEHIDGHVEHEEWYQVVEEGSLERNRDGRDEAEHHSRPFPHCAELGSGHKRVSAE